MKFITLFLFILSFAGIQNGSAQATITDSSKIARTAKHNAIFFKLNQDLQKKFRENNFPSSSDYFKPNIANVSSPDLLNDSVYVQSFRYAAFYNTVNERKPPGIRDISTTRSSGIEAAESKYTHGVGQTAKKDARHFRLPKNGRKKLREETLPNTSDYFKPDLHYASNPALLNDSAYVNAFREIAFYKAINKMNHSPGKVILVAGCISVVLIGAVAFISIINKGTL
jgi:hypothetical protein